MRDHYGLVVGNEQHVTLLTLRAADNDTVDAVSWRHSDGHCLRVVRQRGSSRLLVADVGSSWSGKWSGGRSHQWSSARLLCRVVELHKKKPNVDVVGELTDAPTPRRDTGPEAEDWLKSLAVCCRVVKEFVVKLPNSSNELIGAGVAFSACVHRADNFSDSLTVLQHGVGSSRGKLLCNLYVPAARVQW
jgi:hypothetical protein